MKKPIAKWRIRQALLSCLLFVSVSSAQAAIDCRGTVSFALLYADGTVNVRGSWRNDFTFLCNTNGTFGGISPEVCLSWYATIAKAAAEGKTLTVYYNTNSYTCSNMPTYSSALVPFYVGMMQP